MDRSKSTEITNVYDSAAVRPVIPADSASLFSPRSESDWTYSHHPHIAFYKERLYAIWSNGRVNEDDAGQRVLISSSDDFFHWSEPKPLVDTTMGKHSELVLTAAGFHRHGEALTAYVGQYEYKPEHLVGGARIGGDHGHTDTSLYALTTTNGNDWSEPIPMGVPIIPNHGPQQTRSGRLIISGNIMYPYTDDPAGLSGWVKTGIYPPDRTEGLCDDSESFWTVKEARGWPVGLCEGSFCETDDGVIRMLLRSNSDKLWVTESKDDGEVWSEPRPTEFTDNNTKFHLGRLPDGRFYYVGSPDPTPRGKRNPLVLSLSRDGAVFDRHYILRDEHCRKTFAGLYKGGEYGYPHSIVQSDYLYVIYSICKERIAAVRVRLDTIL
ncbi:exo-alpha-sialidase [Paenibacillus hemerocallicola]|nr:exo-alpha-sialidase [Paenibacillus hemerocallicola]